MVANEFLLSSGHPHLGAQEIRLHDHAAVKAIFAAVENRLRRFHRLLGYLQLFFRKQHAVVRVHNAENNFLIGAVELMASRFLQALCSVDGAPTSERIKEIPSSADAGGEIANGAGVFSTFRPKSAVVNRCCLSLLPKTYTGSLLSVAVSENVTCGSKEDRASLTSAEAALSVGERRFSFWVLFERNGDRLLKREAEKIV